MESWELKWTETKSCEGRPGYEKPHLEGPCEQGQPKLHEQLDQTLHGQFPSPI